MATMILAVGNTTPIAIVPLVLKPPLLPDPGAADCSGGGEAASDVDAGMDVDEPVWLEVVWEDAEAFEEVLASGPHSTAKEKRWSELVHDPNGLTLGARVALNEQKGSP